MCLKSNPDSVYSGITQVDIAIVFFPAKSYEMRIADDIHQLQRNFNSVELLSVNGTEMAPKKSGNVEKLTMTVSSIDAYTSTAYFAVVAADDVGSRGEQSNILPITVARTRNYEGTEIRE